MTDTNESPGSRWDRRFAEHPWSVVPDESLVELASPLTPGRAIDLGCGTGRNALWLARLGWEVLGVDASAVGLAKAREQAEREGLTLSLAQADLLAYEPAALSFDLVVVANIHLDPESRGRFFEGAARAVAPGGHLYVTGHHVDAWGVAGPPTREVLFTEELFSAGFEGLETKVLERRETLADSGDERDVTLVLWAQRTSTEGSVGA